MQFALLDPQRVTINSVNIRSEMHGKDHVPALDLKVSMTAPNTMLDLLGMGPLRAMFYESVKEGAEPPEQPELDGVDPVTDTPVLRSVELEPVKIKHEWTGYTAFIERGARGPGERDRARRLRGRPDGDRDAAGRLLQVLLPDPGVGSEGGAARAAGGDARAGDGADAGGSSGNSGERVMSEQSASGEPLRKALSLLFEYIKDHAEEPTRSHHFEIVSRAQAAIASAAPPDLTDEQIDAAGKAYVAVAVPAWSSNRHRPALAAAIRAALASAPLVEPPNSALVHPTERAGKSPEAVDGDRA